MTDPLPLDLVELVARVDALPKPQRDRLVRLLSHALVDAEREEPERDRQTGVRGLGRKYTER